MKKKHLTTLLIFALIFLVSCRNRGASRDVKEGIDNALLMFVYLLAIITFGLTAMALSLAYKNRKKDKDGLLVASIILVGIFVMITQGTYQNYSFDVERHPFVFGEFIVGMFLIVFTVIQLILGYRRKKDGFSQAPTDITPKIDQEDKEIPDDQEIY